MGHRLGLHRLLPQKFVASLELPEKLVVQVVAVGKQTMVGLSIAGCRMTWPAQNTMVRLLPEPCVCHTTPQRRSPAGRDASMIASIAFWTAWN